MVALANRTSVQMRKCSTHGVDSPAIARGECMELTLFRFHHSPFFEKINWIESSTAVRRGCFCDTRKARYSLVPCRRKPFKSAEALCSLCKNPTRNSFIFSIRTNSTDTRFVIELSSGKNYNKKYEIPPGLARIVLITCKRILKSLVFLRNTLIFKYPFDSDLINY